jgi:hypothetical protein
MSENAMPGVQPVAEEQAYLVIYDDDSTGLLVVTSDEEPPLSRPGRFVSEAEYLDRLGALKAGHEAYIARLVAEDEARTRGDFEALTSVGIPAGTARRLSGYDGEAAEAKP